jgi:hypothetical protein
MAHSDSTYRQYTQALEEEQKLQAMHNTLPNGTLPNGFARGATPTNVSMFHNDALALRSAYDKEEEEETEKAYDSHSQYGQNQYEQSYALNDQNQDDQLYSLNDQQQVPSQSQAPTPLIDQQRNQYNQQQEWQITPRAPVEIVTSEARDYRKLWRFAYKEACKQKGITVS